jgi:hypothetical protein
MFFTLLFVKLFFVKKVCKGFSWLVMVFCKIFFYFLDNIFFTQKWAKFNLGAFEKTQQHIKVTLYIFY